VFYYLLTHTSIYKRLQVEIDGAYSRSGDGDRVDPALLAELSYLNAVMYVYFYLCFLHDIDQRLILPWPHSNETLRLQPAVPNGVQRRLPFGGESVVMADCYVPPGTTVQIPSYSSEHFLIRRHPDNQSTLRA
jgi:cytochrome P450